ncbi:MAG: ParB/RepB/Spo0J family partition protein [Candidatus Omnitrophota bacterium]
MAQRVLGKGLEALIPKNPTIISSKEFIHLSLRDIQPAKQQPRQRIDEKELAELAASIKEKGFIQPVVTRKVDNGKYEIVAGERRYQAAKALGLTEIPVIVKELNDKDAFVLAIVENLQRQDLNPIEEAQSFRRLMREFEFSLEDIARFISKDKTTVANALRLLNLPESIQEALSKGLISRTQARTILGVDKLRDQERIFHQILQGGLSVRDIEKKVKSVSPKKKTDPFVLDAEEKLQKSLGTKVQILNKKAGKGKITIEYYTFSDLERIIGRLTK